MAQHCTRPGARIDLPREPIDHETDDDAEVDYDIADRLHRLEERSKRLEHLVRLTMIRSGLIDADDEYLFGEEA